MRNRPYYPVTYAVRGQGTFPLDMLRYDRACPCREQDSRAIESDSPHPRTVLLISFAPEIPDRPKRAKRWEDFDWKIVPHREHEEA